MGKTPSQEFDVVVLGGGSGGYATAIRARECGLSVALIEKEHLGGTCLHRGCIPTKALLHTAEVADTVRESSHFGVNASLKKVDISATHAYKDGVVSALHTGLKGLLKKHNVTVVNGYGRFTSPTTVDVDGTSYRGQHVVIAAGAAPRVPSIPGLEVDGNHIVTSDDALTLDRIPKSVIILGGGVIGVEFASIWRSFGADVTIVEALPRLIAAEDSASSEALQRAFNKRGITTHTDATVRRVEHTNSSVTVHAESLDPIKADTLLVATGRAPASGDLGLDQAGVTVDKGFIPTDAHLRTNVPSVYAVGDLVPGLQLAHRGFAHGIFVAEHIAGLNPTPIDDSGIPRVTYSSPEVASVGLNEEAAVEKFGKDNITTMSYNLGGNGKSRILRTSGFVKLVQQVEGPVVGVHIVGDRVSELIPEAQLIYNWEALPSEVAQLIHPHPTQSEALGEAHLALAGKPLHTHQ